MSTTTNTPASPLSSHSARPLATASAPRPSRRLRRVLCLDDFETEARSFLPRPIFGYIAGAAETNITRSRNRSAFEEFEFVPRTLVDVSKRSCETELFGRMYTIPVGIAPVGLSALFAYRGDLAYAAAAAAEGVPIIMSGSSLIRLEEVAQVNPDAWFQAYLPGDEAGIDALIERVATAGFKTLVLTVDTCVPGNRENNVRAGFTTPLRPSLRLLWDGATHPSWAFGTFMRTLVTHGMPHFENSFAHRGAPILSSKVERDFSFRDHLNWTHLERIRRMWKGRFVVKGVMSAQDARRAQDAGVDGLIVSNHGGRQLDGVASPMRVLADVVNACPALPVMLDSGVRRGGDVIKAMALGARMVFVGRPFAYGAAIAGEQGVRHGLSLMRTELHRNLALLGANTLDEIKFGEQVVQRR